MNTNESNIPAELYERVEKAYATLWFLNDKKNDYDESKMEAVVTKTHDLGRQPVEIVFVKENLYIVIDQPRNFRDYFGSSSSNAFGRSGCGTAIKMRNFYRCRILRFIPEKNSYFIEREIWSGGHLSKDAEKSVKQFNKFKAQFIGKDYPVLDGALI